MVTFEQVANLGAALAIGIIAEQKVAHSKHLADSSTPIRHTIGVLAATATTYYTQDALARNKDKVKLAADQIFDKYLARVQSTNLRIEEGACNA
ncbi:MAG: hypothetical protein U0I22_04410 [Treponema sp.]|nr:hypothetical protein [Treponema sp.]